MSGTRSRPTPELTARKGLSQAFESQRMKAALFALRLNELLGGACGVNKLLCEQRPHPFDDLTRSRIPKAIRVNDFSLVDIDAELAKSAFYSFHLRVRFFPQLCCHTGSHHLFDWSNRAVMDFYFPHNFAPPSSLRYRQRISSLSNTGNTAANVRRSPVTFPGA